MKPTSNERHFKKDLAPIIFLRQENLNQDLYHFLSKCGYEDKRIAYLLSAPKVNVSPRKPEGNRQEPYYSSEMIEAVLNRDRLIFELFPEYTAIPAV